MWPGPPQGTEAGAHRVTEVSGTGTHTPCKPSSEQSHLSVLRRGHSDIHVSGVQALERSLAFGSPLLCRCDSDSRGSMSHKLHLSFPRSSWIPLGPSAQFSLHHYWCLPFFTPPRVCSEQGWGGHAKQAGGLYSWPVVATETPSVQTQGGPGSSGPLFGLAHLRLCPLWSHSWRGEAYRSAPLHTCSPEGFFFPRGRMAPAGLEELRLPEQT